jgi:hypothetical protein
MEYKKMKLVSRHLDEVEDKEAQTLSPVKKQRELYDEGDKLE